MTESRYLILLGFLWLICARQLHPNPSPIDSYAAFIFSVGAFILLIYALVIA